MNQELPLVSIVTPSYNKGLFIEETILSVKNQTYPHIEHIVVDGGSTDETLDILRKYSNSLVWISEPDEGQSDAINKGWRMSRGEILAYLNADDTYMPWAVETAVSFLVQHPDVAMVYGDCNVVDENGEVTQRFQGEEFDLKKLLCTDIVPQPTAFFRREVVEKVGYLDPDLHLAMDYDLWVRIGLKFKMQSLHQCLASFRLYPGTKSMSYRNKFYAEHFVILDKVFSSPQLPREIESLKNRVYGHQLKWVGQRYLVEGDYATARRYCVQAVHANPRGVRLYMHLLAAYATPSLYRAILKTQLVRSLRRCFALFCKLTKIKW